MKKTSKTRVSGESDLRVDDPIRDPITAETIGSEIGAMASKIGDRKTAAAVAGTSPASLQRYIQSGNVPLDVIYKLALASRTSLDSVLGLNNGSSPASVKEEAAGYAFVPLYDVQASLGHGSHIESERIVDHLAFKTSWLEDELNCSNISDLALIGARGDSMEPTIHDGDTMLIDLRYKDIAGPGLYVLQLSGSLVAKRCEEYPGGFVSIKSDNNAYPATGVQPENREDLNVIGQVVWIGHKL